MTTHEWLQLFKVWLIVMSIIVALLMALGTWAVFNPANAEGLTVKQATGGAVVIRDDKGRTVGRVVRQTGGGAVVRDTRGRTVLRINQR